MAIQRMDHVGVVVNDLAAATAFFVDLGLEVEGEAEMEGEWLDKIVGLHGVHTALVMLRTPDGQAALELVKFYSPVDAQGIQPAPANTLGLRHLSFAVDDIEAVVARLKQQGTKLFSDIYNYEGIYKLCYVHGPEGIIVEIAEQLE